jgi:5-methylcytosine-specific restriction endonuclease McrA
MKCKNVNCQVEANPTLGSGKFCSRSCANTRIRTKEVRLKISKGVRKTGATRPPLTGESLERWKLSIKKSYEEKYISKSFDELSIWQKRRRVIEEQKGCCADCGISEWKSLPINLEVYHKDGNTDNNDRENLRALCPNCHSTTETWRGRNKPSLNGANKVSDIELIDALNTESTIRKALLKVGLAAKGKNYSRAKKLKENLLK